MGKIETRMLSEISQALKDWCRMISALWRVLAESGMVVSSVVVGKGMEGVDQRYTVSVLKSVA